MTKQKILVVFSLIIFVTLASALIYLIYLEFEPQKHKPTTQTMPTMVNYKETDTTELAINAIEKLIVRKADNHNDYQRKNFMGGWASWRKCNSRQKILNRDVSNIKLATNGCTVISGHIIDPYTGKQIQMVNKTAISKKIQIDHVVSLGNAWRTGGRYLSKDERKKLANDDIELIAVSSQANQEKSDKDASQWLPSNLAFRCPYVARQIAVKLKYHLWITTSEKSAMKNVLSTCKNQALPLPK